MSLGVIPVWRAHACASAARGLSLSPRDLRVFPICTRVQHVRHESTQTDKPPDLAEATQITESNESTPPVNVVRRISTKKPTNLAHTNKSRKVEVINASPSAVRRAVLRRVIKQRKDNETKNSVLVKPVQWYPDQHEMARSVRKTYLSKARQDLWAHVRAKEEKAGVNWRGVVSFLSKLTPKFGSIYDFRVTVGRGAADEVRKLLPRGPTAEPGHLQQSTRAIVRVDHVDNLDGTLRLTLTGSGHSVRLALLDLLKASGHITAVRVLDSNSEGMLRDLWQQQKKDLDSVKLLAMGETNSDDKVLTLTREESPSLFHLQSRRQYILTRRADHIPKPSVWTRTSIESYIALLVYGFVPPDFTGLLYSNQADHQQVVVSLLMQLFSDEQARRVLSPEAVSMALAYIQDKKLTFRPAARAIFNQAEIHNLPLDTRICNLFLKGSAISGDLDGFDAMLKHMARKNLHADSETWLLLLSLVQDVDAKRYILRKMRRKGLDRIQSALVKAGRHMAPYELEGSIKKVHSIRDFVKEQDALYDPIWLNQVALGRLLDVLGKHGKHDMCEDLLHFIHETGRTIPHAVALNTIITHNKSMQKILETIRTFQKRWPAATIFDEDTYDMLFQIAWKSRSPNMLRVIWHYASYARQTSSKMRSRMHKFLGYNEGWGRMSLLKTWEAAIAGQDALSLLSPKYRYTLGSTIARWHGAKAHFLKPTASFGAKLAEAYEIDRKIHMQIKEGEVMTASLRDILTVSIPLKRREYKQLLLVDPNSKKVSVRRSPSLDGSKMYYE